MEMAIDWLSAGLDPEKNVIFVQSHVKEHAELALLLGMSTPLSWLERVPTYKDKLQNWSAQGKDNNTYGFLGYPVLMAADIMLYKATSARVTAKNFRHGPKHLTGRSETPSTTGPTSNCSGISAIMAASGRKPPRRSGNSATANWLNRGWVCAESSNSQTSG